jgi:hypothetical protein
LFARLAKIRLAKIAFGEEIEDRSQSSRREDLQRSPSANKMKIARKAREEKTHNNSLRQRNQASLAKLANTIIQ